MFETDAYPLRSRNRLQHLVAWGMDGRPLTMPVEVIVGIERSPRLTLVAGVHGNEMEGILAVHRLCRELQPDALRGIVVAVPVANPTALMANERRVPVDAADLNRVFPGDSCGGYSERLAARVFELVQGSDFLYSLHSWGETGTVVPYVEYPGGDAPAAVHSFEVATRLGFELLRVSHWHPGLLVAAAVRNGIPALEAEIGGLGISSAAGQDLYYRTLLNLLRTLGMVSGDPPAPQGCIVRHVDVRSDHGGLLIPAVALREAVAVGERLGTVVDLFGDPLQDILSPADGIVAAFRAVNALHPGDVAFTLFLPM